MAKITLKNSSVMDDLILEGDYWTKLVQVHENIIDASKCMVAAADRYSRIKQYDETLASDKLLSLLIISLDVSKEALIKQGDFRGYLAAHNFVNFIPDVCLPEIIAMDIADFTKKSSCVETKYKMYQMAFLFGNGSEKAIQYVRNAIHRDLSSSPKGNAGLASLL